MTVKAIGFLVMAYKRGEEQPLVDKLNESINEAGRGQKERAEYLGITPRSLRRVLATPGLLEKYPHVRGRWPGELE